MAKGRIINRSLWTSHTIQALSIRQRYLFIGLFSNADDQGRLLGHPALIRNAIFPFDDIAFTDVKADLDAIERTGAIQTYEAGGKAYIQLTGWWHYQKHQWAYPSDYPPPSDGWRDKLRYWKGKKIIKDNWGEGEEKSVAREVATDSYNDYVEDYVEDCIGLKGKGKGKGKSKDITITGELSSFFEAKTNKRPKGLIDSQIWEDDCAEILDRAGGNEEIAKEMIGEAITILDDLGYSYKSPGSLINTIDKQIKEKKNGHRKNKRSGSSGAMGRDGLSPEEIAREALDREMAKFAPN